MDLFRKILGLDDKDSDADGQKPQTDPKNKGDAPRIDPFLGFSVFTKPEDLERHFEEQMKEMIRMLEEQRPGDFGDLPSDFPQFNEDLLRKQIEGFHNGGKVTTDTDLDDKAQSEQLKVLLDRIGREKALLAPAPKKEIVKRTEEQQVMDYIHDTVEAPPVVPRSSQRAMVQRRSDLERQQQQQQPGGVFGSPRIFGQSIISQTIRKPDGSYETKRTVRDANGEIQTTIIRSENGNIQQFTTYNEDKRNAIDAIKRDPNEGDGEPIVDIDRTMYLSKEGYTLPRNLF